MQQRRKFILATLALPFFIGVTPCAHATGVGGTGKPLELDRFAGKVVLADFWASWCGPCRQSMPWLNKMSAKYSDQGLQVLGINLDESREAAKTFLDQVPVEFDILYDPVGMHAQYYSLESMPSTIIFDHNGVIFSRHNGFLSTREAEYEQQIISALQAANS